MVETHAQIKSNQITVLKTCLNQIIVLDTGDLYQIKSMTSMGQYGPV